MIVDSHCHLADAVFAEELGPVVSRAMHAGVSSALCILSADEPDEVSRAAVVSAAWPSVRFAAGIHPHRAGRFAGRLDDVVETTRQAVEAAGAVAVGEIGLDYHYDFAPKDVQREVFARQVALAAQLERPVVIHTREAADDTLAVLRGAGAGARGVLHCFTGTIDEARQALDLGFYISMSGIVTFPRSAALRDVARFVPSDRLLIETDAPFLAPIPHRGKRNEPAWVVETCRVLAEVRAVGLDILQEQLVENTARLVPELGAVHAR